MAATEKYTEFMGFDNLVMAEVTADDAENYTTGTVEVLAPAGSIKKSTEREQAKRSYDNQTYFIIKILHYLHSPHNNNFPYVMHHESNYEKADFQYNVTYLHSATLIFYQVPE